MSPLHETRCQMIVILLWVLLLQHRSMAFYDNQTFRELDIIPLRLPLGVTILDLRWNSITQLDANCFLSAPTIEKLDLSYNSISAVSPLAFSGLNSLEDLYLSHNSISTVNPAAFAGLNILQELSLKSNSLSDMPPLPTNVMTSLTDLHLQNNDITSIPNYYFQNATNLATLEIYGNSIQIIDAFSLYGLTSLTTLRIGNNGLHTIHRDAFTCTPSLKNFDAGNNPGGMFPCFAPGVQGSLQIISISSWNSPWDYQHCVTGLTGVFDFSTALADIFNIDYMVDNMPSLVTLSITRTTIINPPREDLFINSPSISVLNFDLTSNVMYFPLFGPSYRSQVTKLILSGGGISCMDEVHLVGLYNLRILNISHSDVTELTTVGCYQGATPIDTAGLTLNFPGLEIVDFSATYVTTTVCFPGTSASFEKYLFGWLGLTEVDETCFPPSGAIGLESNALVVFPDFRLVDDRGSPLEIWKLNLDSNNLLNIPQENFDPLVKLEVLLVSSNNLESLPNFAACRLTIEYIEAEHNNIDTLDGVFDSGGVGLIFPSLARLLLEDNALTTISVASLAGLNNLKVLELNDNLLSVFPMPVIIKMPHLNKLYLRQNNIEDLDPLPQFHWSFRLTIDLRDNPFNCSEYICWLRVYDWKTANVRSFISTYPCASPPDLVSIRWEDLDVIVLECHEIFRQMSPSSREDPALVFEYLLGAHSHPGPRLLNSTSAEECAVYCYNAPDCHLFSYYPQKTDNCELNAKLSH